MKLAWKEIKYNKTKYILIESILVLMIFMVIFLSGLANGLARAVSLAIERADADYYVLSEDSQNMIPISNVAEELMTQVRKEVNGDVTGLNIQRSTLALKGTEEKMDITYFAIDPNGFLKPGITQGVPLKDSGTDADAGNNGVVLNDSFRDDGVAVGDILIDSASGIELTVTGFTSNEMYGHSPVGFITSSTYTTMSRELNPNYEVKYHTLAVRGTVYDPAQIKGYHVVDKKTIISNIPGYSAEQLTIQMILWVLLVISAAILGVFFYVITIQKQKQFGVMKAIGMEMNQIAAMIAQQVFLLAAFGVIIGNLIAFGMASMLPKSMPFYLEQPSVILINVVFLVISLVTSLISTIKVAKVDPIIIIGGNEE